jgi:hypothetical protein
MHLVVGDGDGAEVVVLQPVQLQLEGERWLLSSRFDESVTAVMYEKKLSQASN